MPKGPRYDFNDQTRSIYEEDDQMFNFENESAQDPFQNGNENAPPLTAMIISTQSNIPVDTNAFVNLSDTTRESHKNAKIHPIIIIKPDDIFKIKENVEEELKNANIKSKDIENFKFTDAGNLLIYCKNKTTYEKILNANSICGKKAIESRRSNDHKSVIIKDISFNEAKQIEEKLRELGITQIEELISNRKDRKLNFVKAICTNYSMAECLIKNGLKLNYKKHQVSEFINKPKLIVCFNCGGFNHTVKSQRCKKNKSV